MAVQRSRCTMQSTASARSSSAPPLWTIQTADASMASGPSAAGGLRASWPSARPELTARGDGAGRQPARIATTENTASTGTTTKAPLWRYGIDAPLSTADAASTTAAASRSSSDGATVRRSSRQRAFSTRPTTGGRPDRSAAARLAGTLTAALGSCTPGRRTAAHHRDRRDGLGVDAGAAQPAGQPLRPGPQRRRRFLQGRPDRRQRPGQGRLQCGQGQLVDPQGASGRVAAELFDQVRPGPGSGPPAARPAACRRSP